MISGVYLKASFIVMLMKDKHTNHKKARFLSHLKFFDVRRTNTHWTNCRNVGLMIIGTLKVVGYRQGEGPVHLVHLIEQDGEIDEDSGNVQARERMATNLVKYVTEISATRKAAVGTRKAKVAERGLQFCESSQSGPHTK